MIMKKLILIDYSTNAVDIWDVTPSVRIDEEYLEDHGYHTSNCSWMLADDITFTLHKEPLT